MKHHWMLASTLLATNAICGTPAPQPADLEQTFWVCDYVATTQGINATPNECIDAYEQVKNTMFGGDFERMLDWWRQHKPVEHANLTNSIRNASTGPR